MPAETLIERPDRTMTPAPTTSIKATIAALPGILTAMEFGPEKAMIALIGLQLIDWATGIAAARRQGKALTSDKATQGAFKKGMSWCYISTAGIGLWLTPMNPEMRRTAYAAVICTFVWVEVLSIAENGKNAGWPMPPIVRKALSWLEPKTESRRRKE